MINLLPNEYKQRVLYARRNRVVLHWCIATIIAIAGIGVVVLFGQFYIARAEDSIQGTVSSIQNRITSNELEASHKEFTDVSNGIKTIVQILSKQVIFSQLIPKIAVALPDGAVLTGLTLTPGDVALDLQIELLSSQLASQTQVNFADPANGLFEKADIVTINCQDPSAAQEGDPYLCDLNLRVLYKKDASFLFLNSIGAAR